MRFELYVILPIKPIESLSSQLDRYLLNVNETLKKGRLEQNENIQMDRWHR